MLWCLRGGVSRQGGVRQPGALRNLERPGAGERSGCRRAAVRGGSRPMGEGLDQAQLECRLRSLYPVGLGKPWRA